MKLLIASIVVLTLSACSASAHIGEPTPVPTAAPQSPQVIVIQQPAPAQPARNDGDAVALALLIVALIVAGVVCATIAAYSFGRRHANAQSAQSVAQPVFTLTTNNYYPQQSIPPAQLTEAEQFRVLRQQGFTPEAAWLLIAQRNAGQIMPPRQ